MSQFSTDPSSEIIYLLFRYRARDHGSWLLNPSRSFDQIFLLQVSSEHFMEICQEIDTFFKNDEIIFQEEEVSGNFILDAGVIL